MAKTLKTFADPQKLQKWCAARRQAGAEQEAIFHLNAERLLARPRQC